MLLPTATEEIPEFAVWPPRPLTFPLFARLFLSSPTTLLPQLPPKSVNHSIDYRNLHQAQSKRRPSEYFRYCLSPRKPSVIHSSLYSHDPHPQTYIMNTNSTVAGAGGLFSPLGAYGARAIEAAGGASVASLAALGGNQVWEAIIREPRRKRRADLDRERINQLSTKVDTLEKGSEHKSKKLKDCRRPIS